jgi:hypothetical protein
MPRQLRIQYEGAIYHLMSRGDRCEEIFRDDLEAVILAASRRGQKGVRAYYRHKFWNTNACVGFGYDAGSRLTCITNANATISRSYWNHNLLKSETSTYT